MNTPNATISQSLTSEQLAGYIEFREPSLAAS
jgi:hypothetical protein